MSNSSELFSMLVLLYNHLILPRNASLHMLYRGNYMYIYIYKDQILSHVLLPLKKFFIILISNIIIVLNYTRTLNKFVFYIQLC